MPSESTTQYLQRATSPADNLLMLLISQDVALAAQGRELLSCHPAILPALVGVDGAAWQHMEGVRFCLGHHAPYSTPALAGLCRWGISCAERAPSLLTTHASASRRAGLAMLGALASGVPPDSPVAVAELIHQLHRGLRSHPRSPDKEMFFEAFLDLRDALMDWMSCASMLEEHEPTDDLNEIFAVLSEARGRLMYLWALFASALHRIEARAQGGHVLAAAIHWQSVSFHQHLSGRS